MKSVLQFLDGVGKEFAKVVWPSRVELIGSTLVVLFIVLVFSLYLGAIDFMLGLAAGKILLL